MTLVICDEGRALHPILRRRLAPSGQFFVIKCHITPNRNSRYLVRMISLSDAQLQTVMQAAAGIDPERRDIFLQRCAAMLKLRGRFTDSDVADVTRLALCGLSHHHADSAA
jgi:hypothetical protein